MLLTVVNGFCTMAQQGCLKGRGTDLVAMHTSLALSSEKFFEYTVFYAALGVKSAFYIVLRELLLPMNTSVEDLQLLLEDLDVPLLFQQPPQALMLQPGIIPDLTSNDHPAANLTKSYTRPWFIVNGTDEVAHSRLVTRRSTSGPHVQYQC
jgi:hypothetical protein